MAITTIFAKNGDGVVAKAEFQTIETTEGDDVRVSVVSWYAENDAVDAASVNTRDFMPKSVRLADGWSDATEAEYATYIAMIDERDQQFIADRKAQIDEAAQAAKDAANAKMEDVVRGIIGGLGLSSSSK